MKTENGVVNHCCNGQTLEHFCEPFPNLISSVFFLALVVKTVQFVDFPVFVVAPQDGYPVFVFDFGEEDVEEGLN